MNDWFVSVINKFDLMLLECWFKFFINLKNCDIYVFIFEESCVCFKFVVWGFYGYLNI